MNAIFFSVLSISMKEHYLFWNLRRLLHLPIWVQKEAQVVNVPLQNMDSDTVPITRRRDLPCSVELKILDDTRQFVWKPSTVQSFYPKAWTGGTYRDPVFNREWVWTDMCCVCVWGGMKYVFHTQSQRFRRHTKNVQDLINSFLYWYSIICQVLLCITL